MEEDLEEFKKRMEGISRESLVVALHQTRRELIQLRKQVGAQKEKSILDSKGPYALPCLKTTTL